ncbi:hypothetical protein CISG_08866 [Coccidioides immitis RMSCC 3703]|uniref:Uncharacterized protein n=2 Tax=Coccidioides immitis TaxID=5501 RepID=A0A0J8RAU9_COCIT|nr:hypothetical protein CIRG_05128 [Coccidioides immitis RMSCC 2394]KMU81018.1 hypothetical protein CISG_08866 [Coccidioides immitis RMSCC 3703]
MERDDFRKDDKHDDDDALKSGASIKGGKDRISGVIISRVAGRIQALEPPNQEQMNASNSGVWLPWDAEFISARNPYSRSPVSQPEDEAIVSLATPHNCHHTGGSRRQYPTTSPHLRPGSNHQPPLSTTSLRPPRLRQGFAAIRASCAEAKATCRGLFH